MLSKIFPYLALLTIILSPNLKAHETSIAFLTVNIENNSNLSVNWKIQYTDANRVLNLDADCLRTIYTIDCVDVGAIF